MTGGIPESRSMTGAKKRLIPFDAYELRYMAVSSERGRAIAIAIAET